MNPWRLELNFNSLHHLNYLIIWKIGPKINFIVTGPQANAWSACIQARPCSWKPGGSCLWTVNNECLDVPLTDDTRRYSNTATVLKLCVLCNTTWTDEVSYILRTFNFIYQSPWALRRPDLLLCSHESEQEYKISSSFSSQWSRSSF